MGNLRLEKKKTGKKGYGASIIFGFAAVFFTMMFIFYYKIPTKESLETVTGELRQYKVYYEDNGRRRHGYYVHEIFLADGSEYIIGYKFNESDFEREVRPFDEITVLIWDKSEQEKYVYAIESGGKSYLTYEQCLAEFRGNLKGGIIVIVGFSAFSVFFFIMGFRARRKEIEMINRRK